jgi:hypothetical protein
MCFLTSYFLVYHAIPGTPGRKPPLHIAKAVLSFEREIQRKKSLK